MRVAIIGNGISGTTAALTLINRCDCEVFLISDESPDFFSRTALMYVYMGHMRWKDIIVHSAASLRKKGIRIITDRVISISTDDHTLHFSREPALGYDKLIIATGSVPNRLQIPGSQLSGIRGLYSRQDLDYLENLSNTITSAVIVGGGLIGIELAEMLKSRDIATTILVREKAYWHNVLPLEEAMMVGEHIQEHGIRVLYETSAESFSGDDRERVAAVHCSSGETVQCQFVGMTPGVSPNIAITHNTDIRTDKGILVDAYLQTNQPDIYAIGDCAQLESPADGRKAVEAIWYTGKMMGEIAGKNICGEGMAYNPGIWYNSAKFFDIEYQVYGTISNEATNGVESLFWQHENQAKSIRINFHTNTGEVIGFNLMGIRYRHALCEKWIREKYNIRTVLTHLEAANFDPELAPQFEQKLRDLFERRYGTKIESKSRRGRDAFTILYKNRQM